MSVMASYNEIDGVPSHANRWLLRDVLRGEWGFTALSSPTTTRSASWPSGRNCTAIMWPQDGKEAALLAVRAGVNIELPEPDCYTHLVELVREGTLAESELDELVAPMLDLQVPARPVRRSVRRSRTQPSGSSAATRIASSRSRRPARRSRCSRTTATLRRSISRKIKTIAVIGPNADRELLGGYSGKPKHCITVLEGIRQRVGADVEVLYHEGCKITVGGSWQQDEVAPSDPGGRSPQRSPRPSKSPQRADVVVLAVGGNEQTSREAWMGNHLGDRTEPRHGRPAGRAGRRDRRDRQADRRVRVQRPAAVDSQPRAKRPPRSSSAGTSARKRARRSPTCCSATSTPAASCRSRSRARSATCRRTTTTSPRPAAATCSTTSRRSFRSATA